MKLPKKLLSDDPTQADLFPEAIGTRGEIRWQRGGRVTTKGRVVYDTPRGYAARPGSGPQGEKCRTCTHLHRTSGGAKTFFKCRLIQHRWTHGAATDIRANAPACAHWQASTPNPTTL